MSEDFKTGPSHVGLDRRLSTSTHHHYSCSLVFEYCTYIHVHTYIHTSTSRYGELVTQLEEREHTTEATLQSVDKELALQQQASEAHRKKAQESLQTMAELQFQMNSKQKQVDTIQETLSNRTRECDKEAQQWKRLEWVMGVA